MFGATVSYFGYAIINPVVVEVVAVLVCGGTAYTLGILRKIIRLKAKLRYTIL